MGNALRLRHRKPCNECPWRRAAPPGYMGGHDPADYAQMARFQVPTACHTTLERDREPALCVGMAQHLKNSCSQPRDPVYAAEIAPLGQNPNVFQWVAEFEAHHAQDITEVVARRLTEQKEKA